MIDFSQKHFVAPPAAPGFTGLRFAVWLLGVMVPLTGCSLMNSAKLPATQLEKTAVKTEPKSERTDAEAMQAKVELILATAIAQENQGEIDQAMAAYRQVLHYADNDVALYRLALLLERRGESNEAQAFFNRAVEKNPNAPELLCDAGYSAHLVGNHAVAEQRLRRAVELAPALARAHNNLGVVLAVKGDHDGSIASFTRGGCTPADANCNTGYACLLESRWEDAERHFEKACALSGAPPRASQGLKMAKSMKAASQEDGRIPPVANFEAPQQ
ncbi:MAG: hypothetical protein RIS70_4256 [Planctomycetota bacterium]